MELVNDPNSLNIQPLSIHCPTCKKNYLVSTQSLPLGEARFQCTSCESLFAINWMGFLPSEDNQQASYLIEKHKKLKPCHKCGFECGVEDVECSKCGVFFKKEAPKVIRITSKIPELAKAWENVRKNYHDDILHIDFIKLCATHDQLVYASQQYNSILIVNPSEATAQRMQRVVTELIQSKKDLSDTRNMHSIKPKFDLFKSMLFICITSFLIGISFQSFRPLIALSSSILFFMMAYKFWISEPEV